MRFTSVAVPVAESFAACISRLEKKYPRAHADIDAEFADLTAKAMPIPSPPNVVLVPGLGHVVIKVRVASSDQQTGKRSGFRVLLVAAGGGWKPFFAYPKAERADVPAKELVELLRR